MFTANGFNEMLKTDIWLIKNMLTLPSDPPPKIDKINNFVYINVHDTYSINDQIKAVEEYRNHLIPAVFIITQKVYSELFRLLIGNNSFTAGEKQSDVECKVKSINISNYSPFLDYNEFLTWWNSKYNHKKLRRARNRIVHNNYEYDGEELIIYDKNNDLLIQWKTGEVVKFAKELLDLVERIK